MSYPSWYYRAFGLDLSDLPERRRHAQEKSRAMHSSSRPLLARLAAIDQAIRAGHWPNASTLARTLEVSPRTIQRDLTFLRDRLAAPIAFDPVHNGYAYTDKEYRLPFF